jgi:hypothetical protein
MRIKMLSKRWEIALLCWGLAIIQFALLLTVVIHLESLQIATFFGQYRGLLLGFLTVRAFMDLINPVSLWYNLTKSEPRARFTRASLPPFQYLIKVTASVSEDMLFSLSVGSFFTSEETRRTDVEIVESGFIVL